MTARPWRPVRRKGGFSSTELVAVTGVFGMVLVFVLQAIGLADSVFRKAQTSGIGLKEARKTVEAIMSDVRTATRSLARYPTTGDPMFTSDEETTLILHVPDRRPDGSLDHNLGTVKIYEVEAVEGPEGPLRILLWEARVAGNQEGDPVQKRVVAKQVSQVAFAQSAEQTVFGDGSTKSFGLLAPALGSNDHLKEQVLIGGKNRLSDGLAVFDGSKLILAKAPRDQVPIDVQYRVDPGTVAGSKGANASSSVTVFIEFRQVWRTSKHDEDARSMQFLTRNALLNK